MRHRPALGFAILLIFGINGLAQQPEEAGVRHGIYPRLEDFPQATAKEALPSVLNALEQNKVAYVVAQLTDPDFVDRRVKDVYDGQIDGLVREAAIKLADNPGAIKELRRFLMESEWQGTDTNASAKLND